MNYLKFIVLSTLFIAASILSGFAQEESEEIYELSPFSVTGADDDGYLATSTLAGTRIKTPLRDIGASITVATREFLEDTSSNNAEELLVYLGSAEVSGLGGNFAGSSIGGGGIDSTSGHRSAARETRIRGLDNADTTRDYFLTNIPFDSYNTERVLVNRGPNSVLFGLGSPAGIVNNSLIQAANENMHSMRFHVDEHGSTRFSLDINRVLIEDKLNIRVAGLIDNQEFEQEPAFENDRRVFATFTFVPFRNQGDFFSKTTIKGNVESGEIDANRPRISPPGDTITTWWTHANQESVPHTLDWRETNRNLFSIPGEWWFQLGAIFPDPNSAELGATQGIVPITPANLNDENFLAGFRGIATFQDYAAGRAGWPAQRENGRFYRDNMLEDRSIFDYRKILIDGPNKSETADFDALNLTLEQELFDGKAGFEIAYDEQTWEEGWYSILNGINAYTLQIDVNPNYPDGSPNPNFGRPFVAGAGRAGKSQVERDVFRVTAFGEIDFRDNGDGGFSDFLGRHLFTGLLSSQSIERFGAGFIGAGPDQRFLNLMGRSNILNSNFGDTRTMHYLGPSLAGASSASGANIQGIQVLHDYPASFTPLYWDPSQQAWVRDGVTLTTYQNNPNALASSASRTKDEVDSLAFIWQGYWLDDLLVTTAGWRRDDSESFRANTPGRDPVDNHVLLDDPNFIFPDSPIGSAEEDTWTYSAVLHMPDFIAENLPVDFSVHYNQSENFIPAAARFNIIGEPLSSPTGETEDIGFSIATPDNKFVARFNFFDSSQNNVGASGVPSGGFITVAREMREAISVGVNDDNPQVGNYRLPPQDILNFWGWTETTQPDGSVTVSTSPQGSIAAVTARTTEGMELDLTYNPLSNWRVQFNVSQAEATQSGLDSGFLAMLAERQPVWDQTGTLWSSPAINFTAEERRNSIVIDPWNRIVVNDGAKVQELREWRWNLITNYQFEDDSSLKGFGVGGALRWQDRAAIGAPVIFSDLVDDFILDVNNPFFDDSQLNGDLWITYNTVLFDDHDFELRLSVRNLIGDDDLIPIQTQPDGSFAGVRIPQSTLWELIAGIDF